MHAAKEPEPPAPAPMESRTWIGRREIERIRGALKPSAYVGRAYLYQKEHGGLPPAWARKQPNGRWLFDEATVAADARENLGTIGITEAARLLGATRRAVQTWVDEGRILTLTGDRPKGEPRRIPREPFLAQVPDLQLRLRAPAPVGSTPPRPDADASPGAAPLAANLRRNLEDQAARDEARLAEAMANRLRDAERKRQEVAGQRRDAEMRLKQLTREERQAEEQEARLRAGFAVRLAKARDDTRSADRRRNEAKREAARVARQEQLATEHEFKLRETLQQRLADWRRRSATAIATQVQEAGQALMKSMGMARAAASPPSEDARRQSAAAVVRQLHTAKAAHAGHERLEAEAVALAEK